MPKEKSINPAQAQRKADKAKAIKKGKAEAQARKTEKLSKKNPDRLQKQLDELKAVEQAGGKLTSHEKKVLEELERDVKAVRKARETLGDKAPALGRSRDAQGGRDGRDGMDRPDSGVLGKRRRDWDSKNDAESDDSDVPEDVKTIPMPRDTPPPIPKPVLDKWYAARRARWQAQNPERADTSIPSRAQGTSANNIPLGGPDRTSGREGGQSDLPQRPQVPALEAKTVYEAAPAIRDLRKEAVSFVPAAVRAKMEKMKGTSGGLMELDELERLESEGYGGSSAGGEVLNTQAPNRNVVMEEVEDEDG